MVEKVPKASSVPKVASGGVTQGAPIAPIEPMPVVPVVDAPGVPSVPPPPYGGAVAPYPPVAYPTAPYPPAAYPPAAYPVGSPYGYYAQPQPPRGLSIASMVLGIVGVVFSTAYGIGLFPAIAAIITGHIALRRQPQGKGFWIAGLVCGYVGLVVCLVVIAFIVLFIVYAASNPQDFQ